MTVKGVRLSTTGKEKKGYSPGTPVDSAKQRAFYRTATGTSVTSRRERGRTDELTGGVPPPPSLSTLHGQRKREAEKKQALKRQQAAQISRSRSPAMRTPSPSLGNSFRRSASHQKMSGSTRGVSPIPRSRSPILRSPSPLVTSSRLERQRSYQGHTGSPPRSPSANKYQQHSPLLEGIAKSIIENFGIEPEDLKIDNESVLGTGGFGTVYVGDYQATEVAVKVHHAKTAWKSSEVQEWKREVSIMTKLRHPNILMLLGAVFYKQKLAIVTEMCERGTLLKLLQSEKALNTPVTWGRKLEWLAQIAKGMAFLHHKRIFHRDLKAANVFVTGDTMKIADFGLSRIRKDLLTGLRAESMRGRKGKNIQKENSRIQGTFAFIAPEIWSERPYSEKADVYSFGVLITELLAVRMPFAHDAREELSWNIMTGKTKVKVLDVIGEKPVPAELQSIQKMCLSFSHDARPFFTGVVSALKAINECPWVSEVCPWPKDYEVIGDPDPLSYDVD
eukprot:TRINITY_DN26062_c0_g1_i1.p1 TRINITY_DN26062_c0_g1~~TRINITY_DN26062_c0_g1_i1.p1  ORF type:complete len:516 (+),score=163.32 TRINITY_DN26062_c0_g1_i1:39-1550(+)